MFTASKTSAKKASLKSKEFNKMYEELLSNEEFLDLISRSVDHKKRTDRRFELWIEKMQEVDL